MKKLIKIIIDTSIFINPASHIFFGETPKIALENFLSQLSKKSITCYIPPSVYEELMSFFDPGYSCANLTLMNKRPPSSYQNQIPALFVYEFIDEMRSRMNKGLRVAEKYSRKMLKDSKEEENIKSLREEYRIALREGIIDSKEDFDLILLAKELDAFLATSDQGLVKWAHKLGIACLSGIELKEILNSD